jgi:hypothetical protein
MIKKRILPDPGGGWDNSGLNYPLKQSILSKQARNRSISNTEDNDNEKIN